MTKKEQNPPKTSLKENWWKEEVFYQIYPRSFKDSNGDGIGDLQGIIEKLDYLNDGTSDSLGIDAIWFSPFFTSPDYDFGYDISDYCDIDPRYGSIKDFDRLLKECHKRNIKVMLDMVFNHSSIEHPWFKESRSSRVNPKRNWYIWRDGLGPSNKPPNNWRNNFFGPAWTWDEETGQYYLHSFLPEQPDLNWFNPEVREAIYDVLHFWLKRGVDGFRFDVAHHYCKDELLRNNPSFLVKDKFESEKMPWKDRALQANLFYLLGLPEFQKTKYNKHHPETHNVLKEIRAVIDSYPAKTSVGEIENEDPAVTACYYGDNDELHMNFYFDLMFCTWKAEAFRRCIDRWENVLPEGAWPAYTFSNHDQDRAFSKHDSRGKGDARARAMALMLLTLRGTPFIYYGEEIGMKNAKILKSELKDPVGIKYYPVYRGRDGARTPMQWEDAPAAGFTTGEPWLPVGPEIDKRNVSVEEKNPGSLLNLYKKLIRIRKEKPVLQRGSYRSLEKGVPKNCYLYLRELDDEKLLVAINFSHKEVTIPLTQKDKAFDILISTDSQREELKAGQDINLGPSEGVLIKL